MAITDAQVIKFSNDQIRPISEKLRDLYYECKAMQTDWFNGISALCPADPAEMIEDGRDSEGINKLSGNDAVLTMTQVAEFILQIEQAGVLNVIQKPCVRAMKV